MYMFPSEKLPFASQKAYILLELSDVWHIWSRTQTRGTYTSQLYPCGVVIMQSTIHVRCQLVWVNHFQKWFNANKISLQQYLRTSELPLSKPSLQFTDFPKIINCMVILLRDYPLSTWVRMGGAKIRMLHLERAQNLIIACKRTSWTEILANQESPLSVSAVSLRGGLSV